MRDFNQAFSIFLLGQGVNNCTPRQGPDKEGGRCPGEALLVKTRNSKCSFTNEPEVTFRLDIPFVPVWPGLSRFKRLSLCPVPVSKVSGDRHFLTRPGAALPHVGALHLGRHLSPQGFKSLHEVLKNETTVTDCNVK